MPADHKSKHPNNTPPSSGEHRERADTASAELTSKSARKREADRLLTLGRRLADLRPDQLDALMLPENLLQALLDYQRFPSHGAKKRQLQFIGKILRDIPVEAIEETMATIDGDSAAALYQISQIELWREQLTSNPNSLTIFIEAYPLVDRQQLRQLIKKTANARDENATKTQARALFRFIRETVSAHATKQD